MAALGTPLPLSPDGDVGSTSVTDRIALAFLDPGRVKTPKVRSRRGIVFYRRRGFRIVLPLLARAVLRVLNAPAFSHGQDPEATSLWWRACGRRAEGFPYIGAPGPATSSSA